MLKTRKPFRTTDKNKPKRLYTWIEQINIDCDEEAKLRFQANDTPTPYSPLPGAKSKCMVQVCGSLVSLRVDKAVQLSAREISIRESEDQEYSYSRNSSGKK